MPEEKLTAEYWDARYREGRTGWDLGQSNTALLAELKRRIDRGARILIPGGGRAYEALALWERGYANTYIVDWAPRAFDALREGGLSERVRAAGVDLEARCIVADFFEHDDHYDALLEQTFFCAIDPTLRDAYVKQAAQLLRPGGLWLGILFARDFPTAGPPFGGTADEYRERFGPHFEIERLSLWEGSVAPRLGHEVLGVMRCRSDV